MKVEWWVLPSASIYHLSICWCIYSIHTEHFQAEWFFHKVHDALPFNFILFHSSNSNFLGRECVWVCVCVWSSCFVLFGAKNKNLIRKMNDGDIILCATPHPSNGRENMTDYSNAVCTMSRNHIDNIKINKWMKLLDKNVWNVLSLSAFVQFVELNFRFRFCFGPFQHISHLDSWKNVIKASRPCTFFFSSFS